MPAWDTASATPGSRSAALADHALQVGERVDEVLHHVDGLLHILFGIADRDELHLGVLAELLQLVQDPRVQVPCGGAAGDDGKLAFLTHGLGHLVHRGVPDLVLEGLVDEHLPHVLRAVGVARHHDDALGFRLFQHGRDSRRIVGRNGNGVDATGDQVVDDLRLLCDVRRGRTGVDELDPQVLGSLVPAVLHRIEVWDSDQLWHECDLPLFLCHGRWSSEREHQ